MNYDLIFYIAKKTGYCEKRIKRVLGTIGGESHRIVSATSPTALGEEVTHSLRICPVAVIIGGLRSLDDDNLATVLSRVFSIAGISLNNMRKLSAKSGAQGYIIRYSSQMILALPDNPDDIESMLSEEVLGYIKEKIGK
ncbi:MAG: hypothetical protein IJS27_06850 [Ruminococcus sp.]|nr:hypothetical protein [Ruminococcus sp.]